MPSRPCGKSSDQSAQPTPAVGGPCDELIDDHLACVDEVAKLGLPRDQARGTVEAVAVLEPEHARFARAGC